MTTLILGLLWSSAEAFLIGSCAVAAASRIQSGSIAEQRREFSNTTMAAEPAIVVARRGG